MEKLIYVTGGWGYGNRGDNAIFEGMLQTFKRRFSQYQLCITSFSPTETIEQHGVVARTSIHKLLAIRRPLSVFRWIAVFIWRITKYKIMLSPALATHIRLIGNAEAVVLGGGGYFNDEWPDMLRSLYVVVDMAKNTNTPIVIYGQTVGPFTEKTINTSLRHYLQHFSKIAYRDVQSQTILKRAGVPETKMQLSADEANLLTVRAENMYETKENCVSIGIMTQKFRPHLGVHGPSSQGKITSKVHYLAELTKVLVNLSKAIPRVEYLFIPSTTWDEATCRELFDEVQLAGLRSARFVINPTADQFIKACQSVDLMISTNMHPVILATTAGKPSVAISYHYKLDDFMESIGLEQFVVRIDNFDADTVVSLAEKALAKRGELRELISSRHILVKELASNNAELLSSAISA